MHTCPPPSAPTLPSPPFRPAETASSALPLWLLRPRPGSPPSGAAHRDPKSASLGSQRTVPRGHEIKLLSLFPIWKKNRMEWNEKTRKQLSHGVHGVER